MKTVIGTVRDGCSLELAQWSDDPASGLTCSKVSAMHRLSEFLDVPDLNGHIEIALFNLSRLGVRAETLVVHPSGGSPPQHLLSWLLNVGPSSLVNGPSRSQALAGRLFSLGSFTGQILCSRTAWFRGSRGEPDSAGPLVFSVWRSQCLSMSGSPPPERWLSLLESVSRLVPTSAVVTDLRGHSFPLFMIRNLSPVRGELRNRILDRLVDQFGIDSLLARNAQGESGLDLLGRVLSVQESACPSHAPDVPDRLPDLIHDLFVLQMSSGNASLAHPGEDQDLDRLSPVGVIPVRSTPCLRPRPGLSSAPSCADPDDLSGA